MWEYIIGGVVGAMAAVGAVYFVTRDAVIDRVTTVLVKRLEEKSEEARSRIDKALMVVAAMSMAMAKAKQDISAIAERVALLSMDMNTVISLRQEVDQLTRDNITLNKKLRRRRGAECQEKEKK